jgi:hypothetical protein
VRFTPYSWRYLLPLMLLPAVVLVILALRQAQGQGEPALCGPAAVSADATELLLQFLGTQEIQRQRQQEIDALLD